MNVIIAKHITMRNNRDHDYEQLWNVLIDTLSSTIDLDENELDIAFSESLHNLIDATRDIIKDNEDTEACSDCDEVCPDCKSPF